ncbi:MAG: hypothetical protein ACOYN0_05105 [Phycisphaerales bacterium]
MKLNRLAWGLWAVLPVGVVFFHFGPGQALFLAERASRVQRVAMDSEAAAKAVQSAAYELHLKGIDARRQALLSQSPADEAAARIATEAEDAAYKRAAESWKKVADELGQALELLRDEAPDTARKIRWARGRALVRSGEVWIGIDEFERILADLETKPAGADFERATREELATAYYYGARLLRLSGMPPQEWMIESGKARQHFRFLAEQGAADATAESSTTAAGEPQATGEGQTNAQRNLELVLNLEQSTLAELQGKPLPKDSPRAGNQGNRPGNRPGKSKRPPQQRDGRGAGGAEDIPEGW